MGRSKHFFACAQKGMTNGSLILHGWVCIAVVMNRLRNHETDYCETQFIIGFLFGRETYHVCLNFFTMYF